MPSTCGITAGVLLALRRGGDIVGLHTAGYRGSRDRFTPQQERIARGIAQLGSLALQSARLVGELERAHRLVEMLGGTISLDSAVGCGSTFDVWLPTHPAGMPSS